MWFLNIYVYLQFIKKRINAIQQFIVKKTNLLKNNSLAAILFAAKTEIDAMLLRLPNLSCGYLFVVRNAKKTVLTTN